MRPYDCNFQIGTKFVNVHGPLCRLARLAAPLLAGQVASWRVAVADDREHTLAGARGRPCRVCDGLLCVLASIIANPEQKRQLKRSMKYARPSHGGRCL